MEYKPVSSIPPWSVLQSLPPVYCFASVSVWALLYDELPSVFIGTYIKLHIVCLWTAWVLAVEFYAL